MRRLVHALGFVAAAGTIGLGAQVRPDLSGSWSLIEDRSTVAGQGPTNHRTLGDRFTITQSATSVTIETTDVLIPVSRPAGSTGLVAEPSIDSRIRNTYIYDGAEHVRNPHPAPADPQASEPPTSIYRATWRQGQLVILSHTTSGQPATRGQLTNVHRLALSLDRDGTLLVDNLDMPMVLMPSGPKDDPPVAVRSVYRKSQ